MPDGSVMFKYYLYLFIFIVGCNNAAKKVIPTSKLFADGINITSLDNKPVVIYFLNAECPICQKYQGSFKTIYQQFSRKFDFWYIFTGHNSEKDIIDFCQYDSIPYKSIMMDPECNIAELLGAKITPEVIVLDGTLELKQLYSGKIDDRFESIKSYKPKATVNYIEKALISLQKNEAIEISETNPVGCFIEPD